MNTNQTTFIRCCYGYGVSGMAVLVIGAILPSVIAESNVSFAVAGGLLSMMAMGNLTASFLFPVVTAKLGQRAAITMSAALVPVSLLVLTFLPSVLWMYIALFAAGIGRGAITIVNNCTVNIISNNSSKELNLLHCSFAVGAFLAPFLTALLYKFGFGWRMIVSIIIALCVSSTISYFFMKHPEGSSSPRQSKGRETIRKEADFIKNPAFYGLAFILFFYLGVENCINGWFVTYLKSTGVMSTIYATNMVSVTWLVIMIGRLCCAALAKRYPKKLILLVNAVSSGIFFFLLITSSNLMTITIALIGMGFSLSGIYPTNVAEAGQYIKGSTLGMSLLTAISAAGGIVTPQLIGIIADRTGIVAAISFLGLNMVLLLLLAILYYRSLFRPSPRGK